jgi:aryl-alcohol dehydrogenase-like predicted oxidoreductase
MKYNRLGRSGLFVSELCLGTMTFGGQGIFGTMGNIQQAESDQIFRAAISAGINFVDTADVYSNGEAETITGQAVKNVGLAREEIILATKAFGETGPGPNQKGLSRAHLVHALENSLKRLQTDYIDLYQVHGFDPATPIEETLSTLTDFVRQGKVRYIGVSNWAAWQVAKALGLSALKGFESFVSMQSYYSLVGRELEREIVPMLQSENIALLPWSPLAGGYLSKKTGIFKDTGARRENLPFPPVDSTQGEKVLQKLSKIADEHHSSNAAVAIAWLLAKRYVTSVIIGARNIEQMQSTILSSQLNLTDKNILDLDETSKISTEYPGWMFEIWGGARLKQLVESK